ncbi:hypothetical protein SCHPADRAFT_828081 [Schizopora paradoxa]|uniref:tRNA-guanine(15) transglycosylase-like domain-containing protein n=1 Tax=Schizopora paradoxa TaxID=27342 RepID=A0A0H2RNA2_9AGAM|nr:hypothetical protein SCHPADRAFT_828081 [Schizopora paradoxa]
MVLRRENLAAPTGSQPITIEIDTPAALTWTSRGIVPHLTRDHVAQSTSAGWVHVPFESFLERTPPVPTLQHQQDPTDPKPLHTFLGLPPETHIMSLSLRDPNNARELPPNGDKSISAWCVRGVRKVSPSSFLQYAFACRPDVVVAPADTPYTAPPFSQRRIHKNVERSAAWLAEVLKSISSSKASAEKIPILLPLAGLTVPKARGAFSYLIREALTGREAVELIPLGFKCLDDGVWGYLMELGPLRPSYLPLPIVAPTPLADEIKPTSYENEEEIVSGIVDLLQNSLKTLPVSKPRIAITTQSPHEVLRLVSEVGIDLFDVSSWSSDCARKGIGFDFTFPAPKKAEESSSNTVVGTPTTRPDGKVDVGHNFFASTYAHDFGRIAANFLDGEMGKGEIHQVCPCIACSPKSTEVEDASFDPPHTRAYIHHLLQTHEMSAYALLESHNAAVVASFFAGIRRTLSTTAEGSSSKGEPNIDLFSKEVSNFISYYALPYSLLDEATHDWDSVEKSRGKGSLKRARDADAITEGKESDLEASIALGGSQTLGELVDRVKLDAPAVLLLDPAPNVDVDTDVI